MNSPYMGKFRVTQEFKGAKTHDGIDLVGIDSKEIHCVVPGTVIRTGWESASNHKKGFGQRVQVKAANGDIWYYGHLSEIHVNEGQELKITDVIGKEGNTGSSTGSHLHICCRPKGIKANARDVSAILKIPNAKGTYDDGYRPGKQTVAQPTAKPVSTSETVTAYIIASALNVRSAPSLSAPCVTKLRAGQSIVYTRGSEATADGYTWVCTVMDGALAWVAKEFLVSIGDSVKIKPGAVDYNGKGLASFVYKQTYTIMSVSGDRAVVGQSGKVTAAVRVGDLCK